MSRRRHAAPEDAAPDRDDHVKPFVFESRGARALHFTIHEVQSRMQVEDPEGLDLEYTRTMMGFLLFVPDPRRIAMIGLGGGSLPKFCHRHLPQAQIRVIEINPHVIALRGQFDIPPDSERFAVLQADGARWVRQSELALDVLLVDGFDSHGMPEGLAAQRFQDDALAALAPSGVMVVNLHMGDPRYEAILERIRRSFGNGMLVVEDAERCNSIVFAGPGATVARYRPGLVQVPSGVEDDAAERLRQAFGAVHSAAQARGPH